MRLTACCCSLPVVRRSPSSSFSSERWMVRRSCRWSRSLPLASAERVFAALSSACAFSSAFWASARFASASRSSCCRSGEAWSLAALSRCTSRAASSRRLAACSCSRDLACTRRTASWAASRESLASWMARISSGESGPSSSPPTKHLPFRKTVPVSASQDFLLVITMPNALMATIPGTLFRSAVRFSSSFSASCSASMSFLSCFMSRSCALRPASRSSSAARSRCVCFASSLTTASLSPAEARFWRASSMRSSSVCWGMRSSAFSASRMAFASASATSLACRARAARRSAATLPREARCSSSSSRAICAL
mmetsp:Transcript_26022/g.82223  ORF Transcript_26022/g.82223 Transcript_26022/m.82223 type:complete len:311 (-) Transcript_26022:116-1048(-)